jgi:hexokinase
LEDCGLQNEIAQLGVTFGFPVKMTALNEGKLLSWSKEFDVKNAVGRDVLQLLQAAFDRKGMQIKCAAIINDVPFVYL